MSNSEPILDWDFDVNETVIYNYLGPDGKDKQIFVTVEDILLTKYEKWYIISVPEHLQDELETGLPSYLQASDYKREGKLPMMAEPDELDPRIRIIEEVK